MKFRKKPVVIEATQWFPGVKIEGVEEGVYVDGPFVGLKYASVDTLEGRVLNVSPGDWIITGIKGERYPCKPDIFEATYEAVDPENLTVSSTKQEVPK